MSYFHTGAFIKEKRVQNRRIYEDKGKSARRDKFFVLRFARGALKTGKRGRVQCEESLLESPRSIKSVSNMYSRVNVRIIASRDLKEKVSSRSRSRLFEAI